jgi:hypothetical protein
MLYMYPAELELLSLLDERLEFLSLEKDDAKTDQTRIQRFLPTSGKGNTIAL